MAGIRKLGNLPGVAGNSDAVINMSVMILEMRLAEQRSGCSLSMSVSTESVSKLCKEQPTHLWDGSRCSSKMCVDIVKLVNSEYLLGEGYGNRGGLGGGENHG